MSGSQTGEIRIALVMNGGVSLAVWMGGVTHELLRAVRASEDMGAPTGLEGEVHAAWKDLLGGRRLVVDTIAGTSAGGLNGTLLATALARGGDLDRLRSVWVEEAALEPGKLLWDDPNDRPTLLNGSYFTQEINGVLAGIAKKPECEPQEVTLLVTATALGSSVTQLHLDKDMTDRFSDSRRVFRFERRVPPRALEGEVPVLDTFTATAAEERVDQSEDDVEPRHRPASTLARAARASASFPLAFAPVRESDELVKLRVAGPELKRGWLIDGGLLDNAPFEPLIDELRKRSIGRPFERTLLYVTPSVPPSDRRPNPNPEPPHPGRVIGGLAQAVREPDQRLDAEKLADAFEQMSVGATAAHAMILDHLRRVRTTTSADPPAPAPDREAKDFFDAAGALLPTYRRGRAEVFERWLASVGEVGRSVRLPLPGVLDPDDVPTIPRALSSDGWSWGVSTAERILRWWGRAAVRLDRVSREQGWALDLADVFDTIDQAQRLVRLRGDLLDEALEAALDLLDSDVRIERRLTEYRKVVDNSAAELETTVLDVATKLATAIGTPDRAGELVGYALSLEVLSSTFGWGDSTEGDVPRFTYSRITPGIPSLMPLSFMTTTLDDPKRNNDFALLAKRKLYGERWGHFGAFATLSGREHDWLWGRLDAAGGLVDQLGCRADDPKAVRLWKAIVAAEGKGRKVVTRELQSAIATSDSDLFWQTVEDAPELVDALLDVVPEVIGEIPGPWWIESLAEAAQRTANEGIDLLDWKATTKSAVRHRLRAVWRGLFGFFGR